MSSKTLESNLWNWYAGGTRFLRSLGLHRTRIENGAAVGTPDLEECFRGHEWWVELKSASRPKGRKPPIHIDWRDGQQAWLYRRHRAGGRAFLLLQVGSGHKARRYLIPGKHAPHVQDLHEKDLTTLSIVSPTATAAEILYAAAGVTAASVAAAWEPNS